MNAHAYTEDQLVEQPAIGLFAELGWQVALPHPHPGPLPAGEGEAGPPPTAGVAGEPRDAGLLGRETKGEVVLVPRLRAALEKLNPTLPPEATRDDRLETVAQDIVRHFLGRGFVGKAMVVSIDKATALKMHDKVRKHWAAERERVQTELAAYNITPERVAELSKRLDVLKTTDMALIVSPGQNEIAQMKALGLDIEPHRKRMNESDPGLDEKFKDTTDPLRLVFVCAMWLTGFDAPSCSTVYLDKPMRNHTLMQTIARANRVFPGIRAQLEKLIRLNKTRADFAEKFEELIESYNAGSRNIEELFEELLKLSRSLSDEQQRHVRENMSEEELVIFDILTRPAPELNAEERAEVKKVARALLNRLKTLLVLNWRQKSGARAQLKLAIEDVLDTGLPRAYDNPLYQQKCSALFEHIFESYPGAMPGCMRRRGEARLESQPPSPSHSLPPSPPCPASLNCAPCWMP